LLFQLVKVADGIFFFDGPPAGGKSCFKQHTFREGRLAAAGMAQQDYILDVRGVKASHGKQISY